MRLVRLLLVLGLAFIPRAACAQAGVPLGPEFQINTYTTGIQFLARVASDSSGNFVVAWTGEAQDGSVFGVFGQRYSSSGVPLGTEFRVNTYTTNTQLLPSVASDPAGNFIVVWDSFGQDGSADAIFGQRYASSGALLGPEFRVNTYTTGIQDFPSIAADSSGNFIVVWQSDGQDGSSTGVFGQRYAASGSPLGPEFRVNTHTTSAQRSPFVAADSSGAFIVVWHSDGPDGSGTGVFGQRYAGSGSPLGTEFRVNTHTTGGQQYPSVATEPAGNFIVVWQSDGQDGSSPAVFGQRYAASGSPLGPEFRVNSYTTSVQGNPSVAMDSSSNFVVVWFSEQQDGSAGGIFGQRFSDSGVPLGTEFRVNTYTTSNQEGPAVAADAAGNFVVVWSSFGQDGSSTGVFGQRFSQIVPVELMGFEIQ